MQTIVDTSGLDRLRARFHAIVNPNPVLVLRKLEEIIDDDNRKGVLAGLDRHGEAMAPVTYRPVDKQGKPVKKGAVLTVEQRLGQNSRTKRGRYAAFGSSAEDLNNNLSSASYRLLGGPPLAPRKQFSRVITNLKMTSGEVATGVWEVVGAWIDVVSKKGVPFLPFHFDGQGQKQRDLRGIRPDGVAKCRKTIRAWMISTIQSSGS